MTYKFLRIIGVITNFAVITEGAILIHLSFQKPPAHEMNSQKKFSIIITTTCVYQVYC